VSDHDIALQSLFACLGFRMRCLHAHKKPQEPPCLGPLSAPFVVPAKGVKVTQRDKYVVALAVNLVTAPFFAVTGLPAGFNPTVWTAQVRPTALSGCWVLSVADSMWWLTDCTLAHTCLLSTTSKAHRG